MWIRNESIWIPGCVFHRFWNNGVGTHHSRSPPGRPMLEFRNGNEMGVRDHTGIITFGRYFPF